MSFERIRQDILDRETPFADVTLEDALQMMLNLATDAKDFSTETGAQIRKFSEIRIEDPDLLIKSLSQLMNVFLDISKTRSDDIQEAQQESVRRFSDLLARFTAVCTEVESAAAEVEKAESKKDETEKKEQELRAQRGHLLEAEAECKRLETEIARLSDPILDAKEVQRQTLEADHAHRRARNNALDADCARLTTQITQLDNIFKDKSDEKTKLEGNLQAAQADNAKLDRDIAMAKDDLNGYEDLISGKTETFKTLKTSLENYQTQFAVLFNAVNSYTNNKAANDQINALPGFTAAVQQTISELNSPSELLKWLRQSMEALKQELDMVGSVWKHIIEFSEKAMKNEKENKK